METIAVTLRMELTLWLVCLASLVAYGLLTGRINTHGLLADPFSGRFSSARAQLLMSTILSALYYINQAATASPGSLPDLPPDLLLLLGGSHLIHLGTKAAPLLPSLFRDSD